MSLMVEWLCDVLSRTLPAPAVALAPMAASCPWPNAEGWLATSRSQQQSSRPVVVERESSRFFPITAFAQKLQVTKDVHPALEI